VTEIEIPDPTSPESAEDAPAQKISPYRSLFVPLVVVPAMIVMVLVLVYALFGALAGSEDTPSQNLDRLLNGGFNERQQAAFNLVRQVLEERRADGQGRESDWDIDASFLPKLRSARAALGELEEPSDVPIPLVLSSLLAQLGDSEGVGQLCALTALSEKLDPQGQYRVYAAWTLGAIGKELSGPDRDRAGETLIALFDHPDPALVLVATAGLQNLPSEEATAALTGMLGSRSLEQRGTAALSLASLGDPAGQGVLTELLALESYAGEREGAPLKWPPKQVSESRSKALEALRRLDLAPDRVVLEGWAEDDPDPNIRAAARKLLSEI
jgi:HEAT repeat protein